MSRVWIRILMVLVTLGLLGGGLWAWRRQAIGNQEKQATVRIDESLEIGDYATARAALKSIADPVEHQKKEEKVRLGELKQGLERRDVDLIRKAMGDDAPQWIPADLREQAALQMARDAVRTKNNTEYEALRDEWSKKSSMPGQWFLLEVDRLLATGKKEDAINLLNSIRLTGREEGLRYARLALMKANEPWKAMELIDEGLKADPRNGDLLSFRAQIEETAGRTADARLDYVAAILSEPKNPMHREALANFYLRQDNPSDAAETWRETAEVTSLGIYAFKSWFWSRVSGIPLSKPLPECRQMGWKEVVAALEKVPDQAFWTTDLEVSISGVRSDRRPEVLWLKLLEKLRTGDLAQAKAMMESGFPSEAERMRPQLKDRLLACLIAREGKNPKEAFAAKTLPPTQENEHSFVTDFNKWAFNQMKGDEDGAFTAWLAKPDALVGTLLTSGWMGAALIVGKDDEFLPSEPVPDWLQYGYAKGLDIRKNNAVALKWLDARTSRTPASDLLLSELKIRTGAEQEGLALMEKVAASDSPQAGRASWTLAMAALNRGDIAAARKIVAGNAELAGSTQGKEILARALLSEQKREEATAIYQALGTESVDAMIFLSKENFAAKNYSEARHWTSELARRFPEEPQFRENLLKISEVEKTAR